jgi:glycosyltransferase involved in cell wall biosynthesis
VGGAPFVAVFPYMMEDVFRVTVHGKAWMAHRQLVAPARALKKLLGGKSGPPSAPTYAAAPLPAADCIRLVAPLGAGAALDRIADELKPGPEDDVILLNADPALIAALTERRAKWLGDDAPRLHIAFMYPEEEIFGGATGSGFLDLYQQLRAPNVRFYAESEPHAEALALMLAAPVAPIMTPVRIDPLPPPPDASFRVAALGGGRIDKGFLHLPAIAAALAKRAPDIRFAVQAASPDAGLGQTAEALARLPNVDLLPYRLSDERYAEELTRAHVLLTPYDAKSFAKRGSGVAVDAVIGGRPLICTKGSALETTIASGNGLAAEGADGFADAIVTARADYARLYDAAQARSRAALDEIRNGPLIRALSERA